MSLAEAIKQHPKAQPGSYNNTNWDTHRVRTLCPDCGWHTAWRKPGKRLRLVVCHAFYCPKCGRQLSGTTVFYR